MRTHWTVKTAADLQVSQDAALDTEAYIATQGREHPPIVLVDGYNVLYKFVETLQVNHSKHPVAAAQTFDDQRTALEHSMTVYSQTCGVKVVIVYDAINRPSDPVYLDIRTSSRCATLLNQSSVLDVSGQLCRCSGVHWWSCVIAADP